jgi:hypothetical protein
MMQWYSWLFGQILRREAEALLKAPTAPPKKRSPRRKAIVRRDLSLIRADGAMSRTGRRPLLLGKWAQPDRRTCVRDGHDDTNDKKGCV